MRLEQQRFILKFPVPHFLNPCYLVPISIAGQLIACRMSEEEIKIILVDSLGYLSVDSVNHVQKTQIVNFAMDVLLVIILRRYRNANKKINLRQR